MTKARRQDENSYRTAPAAPAVAPESMDHVPVLLDAVLSALAPRDGEAYVDGTFGGGGYSAGLLAAARCRVFGIDRDPEALQRGAGVPPFAAPANSPISYAPRSRSANPGSIRRPAPFRHCASRSMTSSANWTAAWLPPNAC